MRNYCRHTNDDYLMCVLLVGLYCYHRILARHEALTAVVGLDKVGYFVDHIVFRTST